MKSYCQKYILKTSFHVIFNTNDEEKLGRLPNQSLNIIKLKVKKNILTNALFFFIQQK